MKKMEITHEGFRWMIFYDFKKGLTHQEGSVLLHDFFGKTVYNWSAEFRRDRASISDESREE